MDRWTVFIIIVLSLFIYFEIERPRGTEREGEREREGIPGRLHILSAEPDLGFELMNREIVT